MYTIKRAAEQVGITAATLRAWEGRYGVVTPHRTAGGYRVYDDRDLQVLRSMKELVDDGWSAALAAAEARRRVPPATASAAPRSGEGTADASELTARLVRAAADLDSTALATVLDEMFALGSFEATMAQHLFPALRELGEAWADGRVSVAGEHLAAQAVMRRLSIAYEAAAAYGHGPRVALGMAPASRHEIGLFAFAVAARRRGLNTHYLGADLPVADWLRVTQDTSLAAVVLAVPTSADLVATQEVVDAVRASRSDLVVAVGGGQQDRAPEGALRLGDDIVAGVAALAAEIA